MKSLLFRLLGCLHARDIALPFACICKAVFLTDIARNAFLFKARFECHVKSHNYSKLYSICS